MNTSRSLSTALPLATLLLTLTSCSGAAQHNYTWTGLDEATGQNLNLPQGPMPSGQSFTGVYRSPQIGDIHLIQTGDSLIGRYEYDRGSCHVRARLEGSASGNLFRFTWRENHRECGRIEPVVGRGFFIYHVEQTGDFTRGRLFGRWGYRDDDRTGGIWTAFKQLNQNPTMGETPASTEGEGSSGGESSGTGSTGSTGGTGGTSGTGSTEPGGGLNGL